jgi:hypothetical protein
MTARSHICPDSFIHRQYTRASLPPVSNNKLDIFDQGYTARIWLYIFCGLLDAMWQATVYWLMGAMSNDPAKLAYLTGFCAYYIINFFIYLQQLDKHFLTFFIDKSIQSAGAAGTWGADADKIP